jgi:hypothetical protein
MRGEADAWRAEPPLRLAVLAPRARRAPSALARAAPREARASPPRPRAEARADSVARAEVRPARPSTERSPRPRAAAPLRPRAPPVGRALRAVRVSLRALPVFSLSIASRSTTCARSRAAAGPEAVHVPPARARASRPADDRLRLFVDLATIFFEPPMGQSSYVDGCAEGATASAKRRAGVIRVRSTRRRFSRRQSGRDVKPRDDSDSAPPATAGEGQARNFHLPPDAIRVAPV